MKKAKYNFTKDYKYSTPILYKDKDNKKWCGRYTIIYHGEKAEYRKDYFSEIGGLNRIENLVERETQGIFLCKALAEELAEGIDKIRAKEAKIILQKRVEDLSKYTWEVTYINHLKEVNYYDPEVGTRWHSAMGSVKDFFKNSFVPYFKKNHPEVLLDVRKFQRIHIYNFFKHKFIIERAWIYSTVTSRKGWVSSYFKTLIAQEIITENPTRNIHFKESAGKMNDNNLFQTYSKEEIEIIFKFMEKDRQYEKLELLLKTLYYGYVRQEEQFRFKARNFDLKNKKLTIFKEESKRQRRDMSIYIQPQLLECFERFLKNNPVEGLELVYNNGVNKFEAENYSHFRNKYKIMMNKLEKDYPKLFKERITMYKFKHSGVTHFIENNMNIKSSSSILMFVKNQCRHMVISSTEKYMRNLSIELETFEDFKF